MVVQNVRRMQKEKKQHQHRLRCADGEYVDLVATGIIDPAKVTRSALENAASIAAMILTTEALITDIPEKEPAMPGGGPGGMGGMGGMDY